MAPSKSAVKQALDAAGVKNNCPRCDGGVWQTFADFVALQPPNTIGGGALAVALACSKCGFITLHSNQVLKVPG